MHNGLAADVPGKRGGHLHVHAQRIYVLKARFGGNVQKRIRKSTLKKSEERGCGDRGMFAGLVMIHFCLQFGDSPRDGGHGGYSGWLCMPAVIAL